MSRRKSSIRRQLEQVLQEWGLNPLGAGKLMESVRGAMFCYERTPLTPAEALLLQVKLPAYRLTVYNSQREYFLWVDGRGVDRVVHLFDPNYPNTAPNELANLIVDEIEKIGRMWRLPTAVVKKLIPGNLTYCAPARVMTEDEVRDFPGVTLPAFFLPLKKHGYIIFRVGVGAKANACAVYTGDRKAMEMSGPRMDYGGSPFRDLDDDLREVRERQD